MRGNVSFGVMFGYFLVLVIYLVAVYPIVQSTIDNANVTSPLTKSFLDFFPFFFLLAMVVGLFSYATGRKPEGVWGGEA